jgi:hypothetical protein
VPIVDVSVYLEYRWFVSNLVISQTFH